MNYAPLEEFRYDPAGQEIQWGPGVAGWILRQGIGLDPMFLVKADPPIPFSKLVRLLEVDEENEDTLREQLRENRCINTRDVVFCYWIYWSSLRVLPRPDAFVECIQPDPKYPNSILSFPGRIRQIAQGFALIAAVDWEDPKRRPDVPYYTGEWFEVRLDECEFRPLRLPTVSAEYTVTKEDVEGGGPDPADWWKK